MTPRLRLLLTLAGTLALAGCTDESGPLTYSRNHRLADELKVKPKLREKVYQVVDKTFGPGPRDLKVPAGATPAIELGGIRLASSINHEPQPIPIKYVDHVTGKQVHQAGGYALYRRHCQHCHGSSGDGNGPTAEFLYPRPRDYRKGLFKFTSTATSQKPTRADLRKTLLEGLHGTSMPAFDALMSAGEIEQVIDYVVFLSMRGEYETRLLITAQEDDEDALNESVQGLLDAILASWKDADKAVLQPPVARVEPTHASVVRGRDLFWSAKNDCMGCHGPKALGNGQSFIDEKVFQRIVFQDPTGLEKLDDAEILGQIQAQEAARKRSEAPAALPEEIRSLAGPAPTLKVADALKRLETNGEVRKDGDAYRVTLKPALVDRLRKDREAWLGSLDDWQNPIRPANLHRGIYKGGRRPLDLYWRIAKGINGAKMPAHDQSLKPEEIWDLVNFVLTLPYEPELVRGNPPPAETPPVPTPAPAPAKVAGR